MADDEVIDDYGEGDGAMKRVNSVKKSRNLTSRRDSQIAMVLKIGAGGDGQEHVSTPTSLKATPMKSNIRATSANVQLNGVYHNNKTKASHTIGSPYSNSSKGPNAKSRTFATYSNHQASLKRIKSELETIQEKKGEAGFNGEIVEEES